jgi:hypothetical protein
MNSALNQIPSSVRKKGTVSATGRIEKTDRCFPRMQADSSDTMSVGARTIHARSIGLAMIFIETPP